MEKALGDDLTRVDQVVNSPHETMQHLRERFGFSSLPGGIDAKLAHILVPQLPSRGDFNLILTGLAPDGQGGMLVETTIDQGVKSRTPQKIYHCFPTYTLQACRRSDAAAFERAWMALPVNLQIMCHIGVAGGGSETVKVEKIIEALQTPIRGGGFSPEEATALAELLYDKHACLKCVTAMGDAQLAGLLDGTDCSAADSGYTFTQIVAAAKADSSPRPLNSDVRPLNPDVG